MPSGSRPCILPWIHFQLSLNGEMRPCCRSSYDYVYGSARERPVEEVFNGEPARALRKALLAGEAPAACSDCHRVEDAGGRSLRLESNDLFFDAFRRLSTTRPDGSVPDAPFLYLDLRFSNLCNFKCRPCAPELSTAWGVESRALGERDFPLTRPMGSREELERFLDRNIPHVRRVYFAGGEPLLERDHYRFLEKLLAAGRSDVELVYNTNFSQLGIPGFSAIELWNRFARIRLAASLDGTGPQGEYLRSGMRWPSIIANFERLRREAPHVHFTIFPTVYALNVFHLPDAVREWERLGMLRDEAPLEMNVLVDPPHLSIQVLDEQERAELARSYRRFISSDCPAALRGGFERILKSFGPRVDREGREKLAQVTARLDRVRGESFAELFPGAVGFPRGDLRRN